jgi:hypothetical protein
MTNYNPVPYGLSVIKGHADEIGKVDLSKKIGVQER